MSFKNKFYAWRNRTRRRKGLLLSDQCAKVIMHLCTLQLDRGETRELAPTEGATGPILVSGGAIGTFHYKIFDRHADRLDPQIKKEPWRAFADVTMKISLTSDPDFEVRIENELVEPQARHTQPGMKLIQHLSHYFPLLPKPHTGPLIAPEVP